MITTDRAELEAMLNELKAVADIAESGSNGSSAGLTGGMEGKMPKIELYPHNQAALNHLEEALKYTRRAAVIQPTGTGKSFVALAFIERRPNNSFLYLAPSTHIFNQLKHHAGHTDVLLHTTMMTYQKLCLLHEDELGKLEPDYIILDEFHRCGADDWGSAVDHLLAFVC